MAFPNLRESVGKVIHSDEAEEASLGLRPIKVDIRDLTVSPMEMMIQHNVLSQVAAAAEALDMSILRDTASTGLLLLNIISKAKFNEPLEPVTVEPEHYVQAISGVLVEVDNKPYRMEQQLRKEGNTEDRAITLSEQDEDSTNDPVVARGDDSLAGQDTSNSGSKVVVVGGKVSSVQGDRGDGGEG